MADIHELKVTIKADASAVEREMRKATSAVQTGGSRMEGSLSGVRSAFAALVPVLSVGALASFGKQAVDAAGHMNDLAARIGFSASTLSALEPALAASGSSLDDFAASIGILNNQMGEALKGNQDAIKAFDSLGLSVRKLAGMDDEQRFLAVADALGKVGDQARFTEQGRNLLGRGFLSMAPTIREANGALGEHVRHLIDTKDALGQETIDRVDAFGDALSAAAIKARNEFLEAFAAVLKVADAVAAFDKDHGGVALAVAKRSALSLVPGGRLAYGLLAGGSDPQADYLAKAKAGGFATSVTRLPSSSSAKGSNAGLLKPEKGEAAKEAEDYDKASDAMTEYLTKLENERELAGLSGKALAERRAVLEATAVAIKDNNLLAPDQEAAIRAEAGATYDLAEATDKLRQQQRDAQETARQWRDQMTDGLSDIILHFDGAGDAAKRFFDEIAANVLKTNVTGPLADGVTGLLKSSGAFDGVGKLFGLAGARASGGPVGGGQSYLVGENGPEIFTPGGSGYVHANGSGAGGAVVNNTWHIGGGVTRQELANLIPLIEARTKQSVLMSFERGGVESRQVNRRS